MCAGVMEVGGGPGFTKTCGVSSGRLTSSPALRLLCEVEGQPKRIAAGPVGCWEIYYDHSGINCSLSLGVHLVTQPGWGR